MVKTREEMSNYEELLKLLVLREDFGFYIRGFTPQKSNIHSAGDSGTSLSFLSKPPQFDPPAIGQLFPHELLAEDDNDSVLQKYTKRNVSMSKSKPLDEVSEASDRRIWEESPLITGVKLGLDDFVIKILQLSPRSATYVGYDGMNVLQAAVKYGRREVVKAIKKDKRLPPWLFTDLESDTMNTLLHIAASNSYFDKKVDPLRLQDELEWFEMLEKTVPKELSNYRNREGKTAREVFDDKHGKMLKDCRTELAEIGRSASPLVAAVVFTSSFYIPNQDNRMSNRLAFKIFSHVYVLGFSFAATSLAMFLLMAVKPLKQRDFRRKVPWHYVMARFLLAMSLAAFIVAFACNMYLQIYGEQRKSSADLATLLLELLLVPFLSAFALSFTGSPVTFTTLKRLIK